MGQYMWNGQHSHCSINSFLSRSEALRFCERGNLWSVYQDCIQLGISVSWGVVHCSQAFLLHWPWGIDLFQSLIYLSSLERKRRKSATLSEEEPYGLVWHGPLREVVACLRKGGFGITKLGRRCMARPRKEIKQRQKANVLGWDYDQGKLRLPSVVSTAMDTGVFFLFVFLKIFFGGNAGGGV